VQVYFSCEWSSGFGSPEYKEISKNFCRREWFRRKWFKTDFRVSVFGEKTIFRNYERGVGEFGVFWHKGRGLKYRCHLWQCRDVKRLCRSRNGNFYSVVWDDKRIA
jgi:Transcriptional regulator